jgi:hypothetical protein
MASITQEGPGLRIRLEDFEAGLLRGLAAEMRLLLEADIPRGDPVEARLFPDAYEDPSDQDAYERLVGDQLKSAKLDALGRVEQELTGDGAVETVLGPEEVDSWLSLLTDLRLAIGTRLGVTEESMEEEIDPDDPDGRAMSVLHWLGWLQEQIIRTVEMDGLEKS